MPVLKMTRIWVAKNRLGPGYLVWGKVKDKNPYNTVLAERRTKKDAKFIAKEARKQLM